MSAHYEVRGSGVSPAHRSAGSSEAEFDQACRIAARLSAVHRATRYEVRFRGTGELLRDVPLAAWKGGQEVPAR